MECDICGKKCVGTPVHCITCTRAALEVPRIELATTLMERDRLGKLVKAVVEGSEDKSMQHVSLADSKGGLLVDRQECTKNVDLQRIKAQTAESQETVRLIKEHSDMLREEIEARRKQLEDERAQIARRKSDLSSAQYGIDARRNGEADKVQQNIKKMEYKLDKLHRETMEMRPWLCNIAAKLSGLKMSRRRSKDGTEKNVYNIGPGYRLRIYELRELSDAPPDNLSASLGLVAQLLVRIACYLGIRLPAEITLPHAAYPLPTIFRPSSSYLDKKVPFPGAGHSSSNSPDASRALENQAPLPKPRTLFIDRKLAHLAAEDAPAYSLFIEGISLLAYNVAWLCRTQGLKDDFESWEHVSPMGRNLYRLLVTLETRAAAKPENPLDKDIEPSKGSAKSAPSRTAVTFGEVSHATSHSFLNAADTAQYLNGWKLTPTKITDELRAFLLAEQQTQEWDVVSQKEWEDLEEMIAQDPVVVGGQLQIRDLAYRGPGDVAATTRDDKATQPADDGVDGKDERKKGVSGWTKLKSRNDE